MSTTVVSYDDSLNLHSLDLSPSIYYTNNKWLDNIPQQSPPLRLWELNQGLIDTTPPEEVDPDIQTIISVEHNSSLPPNLADTYGTAQTNAYRPLPNTNNRQFGRRGTSQISQQYWLVLDSNNRADQHRPKQLVDNISTTTHKSHDIMHGIVSEVAPVVRVMLSSLILTQQGKHVDISPSERTAPPKQMPHQWVMPPTEQRTLSTEWTYITRAGRLAPPK